VSEKWLFVNYLDTGNITENRISEIQYLVTRQNTLPSRARRKVAVDDILYSTVRPNQRHYGIVKEVLPNMLVSTGFTVITADKTLADSDFLYYYLTQNDIVDSLHAIGEQSVSAYPSIKPSDIEDLAILLPPLEEQQEIGHILRALDNKIANNTKINNHLEQMAQAIFKSWFINFEPWGGEMPGDWREGTLGDLARITSGKRPPFRQATSSAEVNIPLIGASSIMGFTNITLYDERILITGRVGTHGVIQRYSRPCWASDNTLVIKSDYYEFAYQQLCVVDFHNMNRGSTQPLITQTDLKNVLIVLPDEATLREFENLVGSLMERCEDNIRESESLAKIRDALLPRLMSGELSVADLTYAK
jgi:type I restriction enzyme S subunit